MKFTVKITYFKTSGKYYTDDEFPFEAESIGDSLDIPVCPMHDVTEYVKTLVMNSREMPGLCSKGWEGHILVDCEQGLPVLIPNVSRVKEMVA
jgi:hypothetical protein